MLWYLRRNAVATLPRLSHDPGKFKFNDDAESAPEADSGEWKVSSM